MDVAWWLAITPSPLHYLLLRREHAIGSTAQEENTFLWIFSRKVLMPTANHRERDRSRTTESADQIAMTWTSCSVRMSPVTCRPEGAGANQMRVKSKHSKF